MSKMQTHQQDPQHQKPKLLDQVRAKIRTKHYSIRTEKAYVDWIKRYIFFHNKRHPLEMDEREVEQFLTDFAVKKKVSASTQNQALSEWRRYQSPRPVTLFDIRLRHTYSETDMTFVPSRICLVTSTFRQL